MNTCPNCGTQVPFGASLCPACGQTQGIVPQNQDSQPQAQWQAGQPPTEFTTGQQPQVTVPSGAQAPMTPAQGPAQGGSAQDPAKGDPAQGPTAYPQMSNAAGYPPPGFVPPNYPPSGMPNPGPVPGKTLGIIGLILAFLGLLSPIGLILSIAAKVKSKKARSKNGVALAGIIIGAIGTIITVVVVGILVSAAMELNRLSEADEYTFGKDTVPSIKKALGEKRTLTGMGYNASALSTSMTYTYASSTIPSDIEAYRDYLVGNAEFIDLQNDKNLHPDENHVLLGRNSVDNGRLFVEMEYLPNVTNPTSYSVKLVTSPGSFSTPEPLPVDPDAKSATAEELARAVADSWEQNRSERPEVDCGTTPIPLVAGGEANCSITVAAGSCDITVVFANDDGGFDFDFCWPFGASGPSQLSCPAGVTLPDMVRPESCGSVPADAKPERSVNPELLYPTTLDKNVECYFDVESVYCQVHEYSFTPQKEKEGGLATGVVLEAGAELATGADDGETGRLTIAPGEAIYSGNRVCRFDADAVTCWNADTGHGFHVSGTDLTRW